MVRIDSTEFGEITIDGKTYYSDMIVWWDGKIEYREKSHEFGLNEFAKIAERNPEIVVVGTGQAGVVKIAEEVYAVAKQKGIEIFAEKSPKAIEIFNALISDNKKAVAVIHVTC